MKIFKNFSSREWVDWVLVIYLLVWMGIAIVIIWSVLSGNDGGFWFLILLGAFLSWIAYEAGFEKGRRDFLKDHMDVKEIARVLSAIHLYKNTGIAPTEEEIFTEMSRRERWIGTILAKQQGEESAIEAHKALYIDPPVDFK